MKKETPEEIAELERILKEDITWAAPRSRLSYFWKTKTGSYLSFKEFMARWKKGLEGITALLKDNIVWSPPKPAIKRFRYFWKDKEGKELSFREFMARWKVGMEGITPLQQISMQYKSTWLMIIGILCGIVMVGLAFKTLWWLEIILVAALFNTGVGQLGTWQKKKVYERMEEAFKPIDIPEPEAFKEMMK